ncbi:hypothetical protein ACQ4LK_24085, partial [Bacillus pumilus]
PPLFSSRRRQTRSCRGSRGLGDVIRDRKHIEEAIDEGHSSVCTIDRKHSDEQREQSLHGIPTKRGYDRDEWPMAMCKEGGTG